MPQNKKDIDFVIDKYNETLGVIIRERDALLIEVRKLKKTIVKLS